MSPMNTETAAVIEFGLANSTPVSKQELDRRLSELQTAIDVMKTRLQPKQRT